MGEAASILGMETLECGCGWLRYVEHGSEREYCRLADLHERHIDRDCGRIKHGSIVAYDDQSCRCDVCRAGNTERMRQYRQRRRAGAAVAA